LPDEKQVIVVTNQFVADIVEDVIDDYLIMNAIDIRNTQSGICAKSIGDGGKVSTNNLEHVRGILEGTFEHKATIKEVNSTIMGVKCVPSTDKSSNTRH
jgi:hypothetical protein